MLKILLSVFLSCLIFSYGYAAPAYGTKMPERNKIFLGLQNHTILKRYLANGNGKMKSIQEFLLLSYGVFDWLSLDLKGGWGNIKQHPADSNWLDYPSYMGGGYGFRLKFLDTNKLKAVFGFQHISIHPHRIYVAGIKHKAVLDDWQVSLLGSYDFKIVTPYLGTKWSRADYINWVDNTRKRVKSDLTRSWGLVCGFDIPVTEKFWINLEGQFFDVDAVALSLNYGF